MKTKLKIFVFAALGAFVGDGFAGTFKHITVDGSFADWADVPLAYSQAQDTTNVVAYQKDLRGQRRKLSLSPFQYLWFGQSVYFQAEHLSGFG